MSKIIKVSQQMRDELRAEFESALQKATFADGRFSFNKTFSAARRDACVHYTREAWEKQERILKDFDNEVAWHGVARRGEDEAADDYYITDVVVYPQTVTASTVDMDTEEYAKWIMENVRSGDERFDHLFMQAHSHVRMGVTPSTTDLQHQSDILSMLKDDGFYIFMIWNKQGSKDIRIYDMKKNVMFENYEVSVVVDGPARYDDFITEAKAMVKNRAYTSVYAGSAPAAGAPHSPAPSKIITPYQSDNKPSDKKDTFTASPIPSANAPADKPRSRIAGPSYGGYHSSYDDDRDAQESEYLRRIYGDSYTDPYYYSGK